MMDGLVGALRRPGFWVIAGGLVAASGLGLVNGWITGATLMPLLIAIAPCLAMCAIGMCMRGGGGSTCRKGDGNAPARAGISDDRNPR